MKNISLMVSAWSPVLKKMEQYIVVIIMLLVWFTAPKLMEYSDPTVGHIDQSIWLLVLLAVISYLIVVGLCWWLLQRFWTSMGLPDLRSLILEVKKMELWQQLGLFAASFFLLLLAAVGCLVAVL